MVAHWDPPEGRGRSGHLAVIVGFDASGNPVVNDPSAAADGQVQRTCLRAELEHLWVKKAGGTAYRAYPTGYQVPAVPGA